MNLKKSDKIIAVVGIVILIIAAVFIVYYTYEEEDVTSDEPGLYTYKVTWMEKTGEKTISGEAGEEILSDSFPVGNGLESDCVLTDVTVRIMWEDDNYYGGLGGRIAAFVQGLDTLTADISLENGGIYTHESTGEGNETFSFHINDMPKDSMVEAKDMNEAKQNVSNSYQGMNSANFNYEVTVTTGERFKILKPIRSFLNSRRDTGNDFNLYITYNYVYPELEDEDSNNEGLVISGMMEETKGTQTYATMGLPGKH